MVGVVGVVDGGGKGWGGGVVGVQVGVVGIQVWGSGWFGWWGR